MVISHIPAFKKKKKNKMYDVIFTAGLGSRVRLGVRAVCPSSALQAMPQGYNRAGGWGGGLLAGYLSV